MSVNYKSVRIPQTHSQMKSIVNLSYNKKDTITPNLIIPVMCERTIAGDVWNLKLTGFLRWLYLKVPSLDTLKLSLNVFYAEHIDLFQDAQAVLKGSGESEYDDRVEYNFPYITNMLMPYYSVRLAQITRKYFTPIHPASFYYNLDLGQTAPADLVDQDSSFLQLLKGGIDINFSILGEMKTIKFPYDTCVTEVWSKNYYDTLTDEQKRLHSHTPIVSGRAHIGGLYEKLYGVVGDTPKAVNAEPAIMYYLCIDYYYRAQQHIKPFVGRIKGVDKTIDEKMYDFVVENSSDMLSVFKLDNNFFMFRAVASSSFSSNENYFVDGCVCNLWDENQSCLSRFINGNRFKYAPWQPGNSANVLKHADSSMFYKIITYLNGGICPVLKHPDYFTMATIKPSSADPVPLPQPNLSISSNGSFMSYSLVGDGEKPPVGSFYNAQIGYFPYSNGTAIFNLEGYSSIRPAYKAGLQVNQLNVPSIVDLRRSALMQTYYEKINANGFLFQDYMLAFFGQDIEDEHLRIPRLIGRASATFDIIPVVQQSGKSSQDGSPLGTLAANAVANFSTGLIRFSCQMGGFVLVNLSISGNNSYQEAYSRWCFERGSLDQYNPHFLGIGDQAIMNYELFNPALLYGVVYYSPSVSALISPANGKSASESRYLNKESDLSYPSNSVVFNILDTSSDSFKNAVNYPFKGFGFIPRRQELRTAFNKIGGNFKSRSDLIASINPSYSANYIGGSFVDNIDDLSPRPSVYPGSVLTNIGSLDVWTLSEDNDFEVRNSALMQVGNVLTNNIDVLTGTPRLSSAFLISSKPWQRLVDYSDIPPIYMSLNVIAHVVRTITAQSIQGQGVHL